MHMEMLSMQEPQYDTYIKFCPIHARFAYRADYISYFILCMSA